MTEVEWLAATNPYQLTRHQNHRSERKRRLLSCALARGVLDLLAHNKFAAAVESAERFADGRATEDELQKTANIVGRLLKDLPTSYARAAGAAVIATLSKPGVGAVHGLEPSAYARRAVRRWQCDLAREIFGNPFGPTKFDPSWRTSTVVSLAQQMYDTREFTAMPILADALQDAGCDNPQILDHCRGHGPHVRGCFVVDAVLGKV